MRALVTVFGIGRLLFGVALLAVPGRVSRGWVGRDDAPTAVMGRGLGGRDIALGAGTACTAARGGDPTPWLVGGVVADASDVVAAIAAGDAIPRNGRLGALAIAGGSVLAGLALLRAS